MAAPTKKELRERNSREIVLDEKTYTFQYSASLLSADEALRLFPDLPQATDMLVIHPAKLIGIGKVIWTHTLIDTSCRIDRAVNVFIDSHVSDLSTRDYFKFYKNYRMVKVFAGWHRTELQWL
jgi:hypothetical protein